MGVSKIPFNFFLPIWINDDHGRRAMPIIRDSIEKITENVPPPRNFKSAVAARILAVIPSLMNYFVVELMHGAGEEEKAIVSRIQSR